VTKKKPTTAREAATRLDLIGLDLSGKRRRGPRFFGWPAVVAALLLALGVAALRVDLIRMRYALADGLSAEQQLIEEQRELTARMRALRDPAVLARQARELGFVHPDRVIDLTLERSPAHDGEGPTLALWATQP